LKKIIENNQRIYELGCGSFHSSFIFAFLFRRKGLFKLKTLERWVSGLNQ
jgi:hypothetical protein